MAQGIKVRELFTLWGFDIDSKPLKEVDKLINNTKKSLGLAKLAVGGLVVSALGAAKFTADAGDQAVKTAAQFNMTTQAWQELAFGLREGGVDLANAKTGLALLSSTARNAHEGGKEAQAALKAVGVSATDANGKLKPTSVLLYEVANAFQNMGEEQRNMAPALARGLFGRGGLEWLDILYKGEAGLKGLADEAHRVGAVLSDEDALGGKRFNDSMNRTWEIIKGVRNAIGVQLLPIIGQLVDAFGRWLSDNRELIASGLAPWLRMLGDLMKGALGAAMALAQGLILMLNVLAPLVDLLRPVVFLLAVFAAGKAVLTAVAMAKAIYAMVLALQAMNAQLLLANALTGFVPLLLGLGALGADYAVRGDRSVMGSLFGTGAAGAVPLPGLAGAGRSVTNVTELKPQINVTVPAAKDPVTQGIAVGQAAHHEMNKMMRQSMKDLQAQTE